MSEKKDTAFFLKILRKELCLVANQDPNLEKVTPNEIADDTILYDLGIDSIDLLDMAMKIGPQTGAYIYGEHIDHGASITTLELAKAFARAAGELRDDIYFMAVLKERFVNLGFPWEILDDFRKELRADSALKPNMDKSPYFKSEIWVNTLEAERLDWQLPVPKVETVGDLAKALVELANKS